MFNWRKRQSRRITAANDLFVSFFDKNVTLIEKEKFRHALDNYDTGVAAAYLSDLHEAARLVSQIPGQKFDVHGYLDKKMDRLNNISHYYDLELDFYYGLVLTEYHVKLFSHIFFDEFVVPRKLMNTEDFFNLVLNTKFDNDFDPAHNLSIGLTCCPPKDTMFESLLTQDEREALLEKYCLNFKTEIGFLASWSELERLLTKFPMITLLFQKYMPLH